MSPEGRNGYEWNEFPTTRLNLKFFIMRKVTEQIIRAFRNGETKKIGNSSCRDGQLFLHGNKIAEYRGNVLWIRNAGWWTNTTKERLNGLPCVWIAQKNYRWYLNGQIWDGNWIAVTTEPFRAGATIEVEIDVTSEWTGKFSRPIYSAYHTNSTAKLEKVEKAVKESGIPYRVIESDTVGTYKPNYFIVVPPEEVDKAKRLTDEL